MSNRREITRMLSLSLEKYIDLKNDPRVYWAREVTFDYSTDHAVRVDYMQFKPLNNTVSGIEKGDFYCYEIKSSVEDFRSGHGLNFIGDYNYLVMPQEVYFAVSEEIPNYVGVLTPYGTICIREWYDLKLVKKAKREDREKPLSEMLFMMFRSCGRDRSRDEKGDGKCLG